MASRDDREDTGANAGIETLVVETHRYKDGHEIAIVERIRIQDGQMIYKHEITGQRGKRKMNGISSSTFRSINT